MNTTPASSKTTNTTPPSSFQRRLFVACTTVFLALAFVIAGFGVCAAIPYTTTALAQATSNDAISPFSHEELVQAAEATRTYTVSDNNKDALFETIAAINEEAQTPYANASLDELKAAPDAYTLTPDAISHLDDVYNIIVRLNTPCWSVIFLALFCAILVGRFFGKRARGTALAYAGGIVIIVFVVCGMWALIDFNGLFALFHSFFFADGTWTFPNDSLLICMYPEMFWVGMGAIWLCVTCLVSLICFLAGVFMMRRYA